jgi:hypothetical protein
VSGLALPQYVTDLRQRGDDRAVVAAVDVMARPRRLAYPGAFYHVLARGNNRQTVVRAADDCELFFTVLGDAVDRCTAGSATPTA